MGINPAGDSRSPIGVEDKLCGRDGLGDFLLDHQGIAFHLFQDISSRQIIAFQHICIGEIVTTRKSLFLVPLL